RLREAGGGGVARGGRALQVNRRARGLEGRHVREVMRGRTKGKGGGGGAGGGLQFVDGHRVVAGAGRTGDTETLGQAAARGDCHRTDGDFDDADDQIGGAWRDPGRAVGRRGDLGADIDAVHGELHAGDAEVVGRGRT